MNIFIISLITFLIPVGVLAIGLLDIYSNRNSGISRTLFGAFLFSVLSFFLFNLMSEVKMGSVQIIGFVLLMPFSMLAGPLMLMYHKSLMGEDTNLLGKKKIAWNFIPAAFTIFVLIIGMTYFTMEEVNEILTSQKLTTLTTGMITARATLIFAHILWYIQLFWYTKKIQAVYEHQQRKYGKFYATYEERNEQLMLREVLILIMVAVYDLMFWIVRVRDLYLMIAVNVFFGVALAYLVLSGREQIDIKRYRMYKLNSHEHEIKEKYRKKSKKRKRSV